ncbi:unnamed protein product [marine sediment metagenome]|uniref:Uncharacterized protein n=1 Tax=marine sediment metagenome TaxID=412755 RepID=X0ZFN8_9ZZZZ
MEKCIECLSFLPIHDGTIGLCTDEMPNEFDGAWIVEADEDRCVSGEFRAIKEDNESED